jgi:hypothetical protein
MRFLFLNGASTCKPNENRGLITMFFVKIISIPVIN